LNDAIRTRLRRSPVLKADDFAVMSRSVQHGDDTQRDRRYQ
jgi:hypothetical protein